MTPYPITEPRCNNCRSVCAPDNQHITSEQRWVCPQCGKGVAVYCWDFTPDKRFTTANERTDR